jgi:hypothetical protein
LTGAELGMQESTEDDELEDGDISQRIASGQKSGRKQQGKSPGL